MKMSQIKQYIPKENLHSEEWINKNTFMVRLTNKLLGRTSTSTPHPHYQYSFNTWIPGLDSGGETRNSQRKIQLCGTEEIKQPPNIYIVVHQKHQ